MHKLTKIEYGSEALQRLVRSVTFFKDLVKVDRSQVDLLLSVSEFVRADAGDVVMSKGDVEHTLYFLLRGQMSVYSGSGTQTLNTINPGEVVGTLSMVSGSPRSATVVAQTDVILLSIDHMYFNDVNDYSLFTLQTKLIAYRMVIHNIRWTLEMNKMQNPNHVLAPKLLKMPIYSGVKDTKEELMALHEHSRLLALLLCEWNEMQDQPLLNASA